MRLYLFFFFQAEDGIRDKLVTGVQTCALPILFGELREMVANQEVGLALKAGTVEEFLPAGKKLTRQQLAEVNFADMDLKTLRVANKTVNEKIRAVLEAAQGERAKIEEKSEDQIDKILQPD